MAGVYNVVRYWLEDDGMLATPVKSEKPPYRVPSMAEIAALPWNGLNVVSTFSGCGGSCLGYRMAGYRVLWANEFLPAAQECYRLNHPRCVLDCRDVRAVRPEEILAAAGLRAGELDLFDSSPPCQAFSTAGKRHKGWGKAKQYDNGIAQCNESLFAEYIRLLRGLRPKVFVAENVSGLVKGVAKGYFLEILAGLKACSYRVEARLLDAQWLGVPQTRQRIIFQGVREDLSPAPAWPKPLSYRYSVREALDGVGFRMKNWSTSPWVSADLPAPTIRATGTRYIEHDEGGAWNTGDVSEVPCPTGRSGRAGTMFTVYRDCRGAFGKAGDVSDEPVPARMAGTAGNLHVGSGSGAGCRRKFTIAELKRVCAFPDDFRLTGSYAQQWACLGNAVPPVMMYHLAAVVRDRVLAPEKAG